MSKPLAPHPPPPEQEYFDPVFDPDYCRGLLSINKPHLLVAAIQAQALAWQVAYGMGHARAARDAAFMLFMALSRMDDFNRTLPGR
ncbi:hypothetical protein [Elstera sp.]|jgi:hypothetical protein|uniref:hypothetical protein n=1 Tax=Elstera sp. TaxID=1916664 RepID=UPI0037C17338